MPTTAPASWTCSHCHHQNTRIPPLGRVVEEFVCSHCGNTGPGTIPGRGFSEGGGRSNLRATDQFDGLLSAVALNPASMAASATGLGTVTLDAPAPVGGQVVTLSSGTVGTATVPASVTVAEGKKSATFVVTGVGAGTTVITATQGTTNKTVTQTCTS